MSMAIYPIFTETTQASYASATQIPEVLHASLIRHDISSTEVTTFGRKISLVTPRKNLLKENYRGDGQSCRDLLIKGREGTRRRQRYENANFLNIPNSQPPLPSDWEVHPTYPVRQNLPYYLAPLWESKYQSLVDERSKGRSHRTQGKVPRDLKAALKKAKGARNLLQDIECDIRAFIQNTLEDLGRPDIYNQVDTDDEDIVFVGLDKENRDIVMSDEARAEALLRLRSKSLVFEGPRKCDRFARWLVHELAEYYGLDSTSERMEKGNSHDKKRVVVGFGGTSELGNIVTNVIRAETETRSRDRSSHDYEMPRPLWGLV